MKHLLLVIVLVVGGYTAWQLTNPLERRRGLRLITRHGLRLGALLLIALALVALAYFLPSTNIL